MNIGAQNRGASNSIASPGVSVLFGGVPSYKDAMKHAEKIMPSTFVPPSHSYLHQTPAYIPRSEASIPKNLPTTSQKAPERTYEKPERVEKPQSSTQNQSSGTQKAHVQKPETSHQSHAQPETHQKPQPTTKPSHNSHVAPQRPFSSYTPNAQTKITRNFLNPLYQKASEQKPAMSFANLHNTFQQKQGTKAEAPPTVTQARMYYRQQNKDVPTTEEIAETVNAHMQKDKAELGYLLQRQRRDLDHELATQVGQHNQLKQLQKYEKTEGHKASPGFEFEYYSRHPKMQAANNETKHFQKNQKTEDAKRRQHENAERRMKPSSVLSPQEYEQLTKTSKQELLESKKQMEQELKTHYDTTTKAARQQAQSELDQRRRDEIAKIEATKKMIERENMQKANKLEYSKQEMDNTLQFIGKRKKDEWNSKVNDHSNQVQSQKFQSENQRLKAELANEKAKQSIEYRHELDKHKHYNKERRTRLDRANEPQGTAFDFE